MHDFIRNFNLKVLLLFVRGDEYGEEKLNIVEFKNCDDLYHIWKPYLHCFVVFNFGFKCYKTIIQYVVLWLVGHTVARPLA